MEQRMPCPACGQEHVGSDEDRVWSGPKQVDCPCGLPLKMFFPLFAGEAQPFGWRWAGVCGCCKGKMTDQEVAYSKLMECTPLVCSDCMGIED